MKKHFFLLFFLLPYLSFTQVDDIVNILDMPLGLSIESVKEKWEKSNMDNYAHLLYSTDDLLKYESKRDSFYLVSIFYFVEDSLYSFVCSIKQTLANSKQLSILVRNSFGVPDSIRIEKLGKENKGNLKEYILSFWSKMNYINNSIDNISISQGPSSEGLKLFSFSKYNTTLVEKARLQKKHQSRL